jgi:hypothetical protein
MYINIYVIYKRVIKPIWTYGIELWGCASKTNIAINREPKSKYSVPSRTHPTSLYRKI